MFLHLSVILFTGRGVSASGFGGVCLWVHGGVHPLGRPPSRAPQPRADTPIGRDPSGQTPRQPPLSPETVTAADGMHPTGMHSCCGQITSLALDRSEVRRVNYIREDLTSRPIQSHHLNYRHYLLLRLSIEINLTTTCLSNGQKHPVVTHLALS